MGTHESPWIVMMHEHGPAPSEVRTGVQRTHKRTGRAGSARSRGKEGRERTRIKVDVLCSHQFSG